MTPGNDPQPGDQCVVQRLRSILAFVFDVSPATLDGSSQLGDLPQWSSLSFIVMMTAIENDLGEPIDRDRAWRAETLGELADIIRAGRARSYGPD